MGYLKKHLFCVLALMTIALGQTTMASQTVLIDFNDHAGAGGTGWNTLQRTFSVSSTMSLTDTAGSPSGLTIGPFSAAGVAGADTNVNTASTAALNVLTADIPAWANANAVNDYFFLSGTEVTGGFLLTGLQAGWIYDVNLAVFAGNANRLADYVFSVYNASDETYRTVATFSGVNARYNGTTFFGNDLSFSFTALAGEESLRLLATTGSGDNTLAVFNAMQIIAIPEPSTLLFGSFAMGALIMVRRRR